MSLRNQWTSLLGENRFVYIRSALFACMNCVCISRNACILKFHYAGQEAVPPLQTLPPLLFEIKFLYINLKLYSANQCMPRRHKSKHRNEWASFEDSWYVLEYRAPFDSIGTNFVQPSPRWNRCRVIICQNQHGP